MEYCEAVSTPQMPVLKELERETYLKMLSPQMIAGPLQGQLLMFLSKMIQPQTILEIGTFTGYSAICLAQGLKEGGSLHTIEVDEELEEIIKRYTAKSDLANNIKLYIGEASEVIQHLPLSFDLVYIDADKENYSTYYDLVFDKVNSGGYIIADNILWSGKVLKEPEDKETRGIIEFTEKVKADDRVDNLLVPVRDGIMIVRKR